jgi:putative acetyltransferase
VSRAFDPQRIVRDARDADAEGLIALIGAVFAEYPGCVLDVDGEIPELRAIRTAFEGWGGRFWVAELEGRIVGSVGLVPAEGGRGAELRKLYVARECRRSGLGSALCERVEREARTRGARFVELWSDTRFEDAHRLYEGRAYRRGPHTRELGDLSRTVEYYYRKELGQERVAGARTVRGGG